MQSEKYTAAIETHKFYDSVSITIVGGMITVSGATIYLLEKVEYSRDKAGVVVVVIFVILALLWIYRHSSKYSNIARNVAAKIEGGDSTIGVSTVYKNMSNDPNCPYAEYRAVKKWNRGIYGAVHFLCGILVLGFAVLAVTLW